MNSKDRAVLYGLAIGDGHISYRTRFKDGKYRYEQAEMILGHSPVQRDYLEWKARKLQEIFGGKVLKISEVQHTLKATNKIYKGLRVAKTNPYFRQMHRVLYKEGKKVITPQVLSYLDEVSLAIMFMDDGSIGHNKSKDGNVTSLNTCLCLQLSEKEADLFVEWLKNKFDLDFKKTLSKGKWDIRGATQATLQFSDLIIDHIHPSIFYKFKSVAKLVIRKSARHPFLNKEDDDIVQTVKTTIDREEV